MKPEGKGHDLKKMVSFCFLLTLLFPYSLSWATELRLVVLDVGMGQSVLLVEDGHGLLIDSGLETYAPHVLARVEFYGVNTLDYMVFSHLHADHAAGYFQIRAAWPDAAVFDNCYVPKELHHSEEESFKKIHAALAKDPLRGCLAAGDTVHWRGHSLQVLWPMSFQQRNMNYNSLVLLFTTKEGRSVLIMGDVDKSVEQKLQKILQKALPKGLDLYVAAHHAAADSCDSGFLSILRPRVSMVSVGTDNPFGYPSKTSIAVLERYSEEVMRTDKKW